MNSISKPKRISFRIARGILLAFFLIFGLFFVDHLPSLWNEITPPADLSTIEEFREWKKDGIQAEGSYVDGEEVYTVILGERSAFLASGPAAYVFDADGKFIDWTRDMGDIYSKKKGYNLTSGNVRLADSNKP